MLSKMVCGLMMALMLSSFSVYAQPRAEEPAKTTGFALVELFTSEGCNSCPPAEENLKALHDDAVKAGKPVYILAYHVDYWNRLGWVDPYSNVDYTQRQTAYARTLQKDGLYTPQAVVNGQWEGPGSNRRVLDYLVDRALKSNSNTTITASGKKNEDRKHVSLQVKVTNAKPGVMLQIAVAETFRRQVVTAGENGGRTLDHAYVVRKLQHHQLSHEEATNTAQAQFTLQIPDAMNHAVLAVVVFVQDPATQHIMAATEVDIPY